MLVIGILLFAAAVTGVEVASVGSVDLDVDVFGRVYATSTGIVFLVGVVTALAACVGLLLIGDGMRRRSRRRAEHRAREAERNQLIVEAEQARAERAAASVEREHALVDDPQLDLREPVRH